MVGLPRQLLCCMRWPTPPLYDSQSGLFPMTCFFAGPDNSPTNLGPHKYLLWYTMLCSHCIHCSSYSWKVLESPSHCGTPSFDLVTPKVFIAQLFPQQALTCWVHFPGPLFSEAQRYHSTANGPSENSSRWSSKVLGNMASSYPNRYGPAVSSSALQPIFLGQERLRWKQVLPSWVQVVSLAYIYIYLYLVGLPSKPQKKTPCATIHGPRSFRRPGMPGHEELPATGRILASSSSMAFVRSTEPTERWSQGSLSGEIRWVYPQF